MPRLGFDGFLDRLGLTDLAEQIGGAGTRVRDPQRFMEFLRSAGDEFQRLDPRGQPSPDAGLIERLAPGFNELATPTIPEQFETSAPSALQPTARLIRDVSSPLGLATLPLGGSARVIGGGLAGAAVGATAGQAAGGDTGEIVGAIGGGVAGGIPAVQRLAGRGVTAAGRGAVRAGDEAALRLQGRHVVHAATEPEIPTGRPPQVERLIRDGGGLRTEEFTIRKTPDSTELPATKERLDAFEIEARNILNDRPEFSAAAALRHMATRLEQEGVEGLGDAAAGVSGSQLDLAEQLLGKDLGGLPPQRVAQEMRVLAERMTARAQDTLRRIDAVRSRAEEAAIERGMAASRQAAPPPAPAAPPVQPPAQPPQPPAGGVPPATPGAPLRPPAAPQPRQVFDPFGLGQVTPGLDTADNIFNRLRDITHLGIRADPDVTPAMRNRARILRVGDTQKDLVANEIKTQVDRLKFTFDDQGRIADLAGIDPEAPKGPIFATLAARLPVYAPHLSPERMAIMQRVRDTLEPYSVSLQRVGVDVGGQRPDIVEGGFYFPRTRDLTDIDRAQVFVGRSTGRTGHRKHVSFDQAEQGLAKGIEYLAPDDAARGFIQGVTRDVADAETANFIKSLGKDVPLEQGSAPPTFAQVQLRGMQDRALPNKLADAVNTVVQDELPGGGPIERIAGPIRRVMQAGLTTADNSWVFIQGIPGLYDNPRAFGTALKANTKAWLKDDVIRAAVQDTDRMAQAKGLPSATELARFGLNLSQGGSSVLDVSLPGRLRRVPVLKQAQRAFETGGTIHRLHHAYDLIEEEIAQGRTVQDLIQSGDMERLTRAANRLTGVADTPTGGVLGQHLLFAARFLQARMANVANGVMGLRSVELGDVVPFLPERLNARVGFKTPLEQRYARRAMLRMFGYATAITAMGNEILGNETDYRPIVNGRWNSNFIKLRLGSRDISLLGPYDSLLRLVIGSVAAAASGRPGEAIGAARALAAPHIALAWDLMSGESAVGEPVPKITEARIEDIPRLAGRVAQGSSPIAVRNVPEAVGQAVQGGREGDVPDLVGGTVGAGMEVFGGKTAPLSFTDEANRVSQKRFNKDFNGLTPSQKTTIRNAMFREAPEVMLRSAERDFAEFELRRLNSQGINTLKSSLRKLINSGNERVANRARDLLRQIDGKRRPTESVPSVEFPVLGR